MFTDLFIDREEPRLRAFWRILSFMVVFVIVQIVIGVFLALMLMLYYLSVGGIGTMDGVFQEILKHKRVATALTVYYALGLSIYQVVIWRLFIDHRNFSSMGLRRPKLLTWLQVGVGSIAGGMPIAFCLAIFALLGLYRYTGFSLNGEIILMFVVFVAAAFVEELVFRGYMLANLLENGRALSAILISSLLFSLFHGFNPGFWLNPFNFLNILLAGIVLSQCYLLTGNLWFPTAVHFGWNFWQGSIFGIPVSGMKMKGVFNFCRAEDASILLTGGQFGLEGSGTIALIQIACVVFLWVLHKKLWQVEVPEEPLLCVAADDSGAGPALPDDQPDTG